MNRSFCAAGFHNNCVNTAFRDIDCKIRGFLSVSLMENMRTVAFQVPESLFQRIKDYLQRNNMTQRQFLLGLIEAELDRDLTEREAAVQAVSDDQEQEDKVQGEDEETACEGEADEEFAPESDDQSEADEESASEEYGDYDDDELEDESEDADEAEDEEESTGMGMGM